MKLSDLDTLIPSYAKNKQEFDYYKKLCEKENAQIKKIMMGFVVQQYPAGKYVANCKVVKKETFDEEMLINIIKSLGIVPNVIKTKEYIDYDELEQYLYTNDVPKEIILELDKAKEVKDVVTLRVTTDKRKDEVDE